MTTLFHRWLKITFSESGLSSCHISLKLEMSAGFNLLQLCTCTEFYCHLNEAALSIDWIKKSGTRNCFYSPWVGKELFRKNDSKLRQNYLRHRFLREHKRLKVWNLWPNKKVRSLFCSSEICKLSIGIFFCERRDGWIRQQPPLQQQISGLRSG